MRGCVCVCVGNKDLSPVSRERGARGLRGLYCRGIRFTREVVVVVLVLVLCSCRNEDVARVGEGTCM